MMMLVCIVAKTRCVTGIHLFHLPCKDQDHHHSTEEMPMAPHSIALLYFQVAAYLLPGSSAGVEQEGYSRLHCLVQSFFLPGSQLCGPDFIFFHSLHGQFSHSA